MEAYLLAPLAGFEPACVQLRFQDGRNVRRYKGNYTTPLPLQVGQYCSFRPPAS